MMSDKRIFVFLQADVKKAIDMTRILRYGLLLMAMVCAMSAFAQTTKWRDVYKVKKKDTIFGIANKYGISIPELMEANPEMKVQGYVLKKDDTLFIPFSKEAKPAAVAQGSTLTTTVQETTTAKTIKIGVMLPLHDVDGDGRRMVEYYRGMLMACDDLKRQGISTNIHAWNVPIDADIRQTLLQNSANKCDIIFGPLYTKQVQALSEFCKNNDIKMVIPFSIEGNTVDHNKCVFQVYQSPAELNEDAIKAFLNRFPNAHPVFVDCADSTSRKGTFTMGLRKQLEKNGISYNLTSLRSPEESFAKAFDRTRQNVVILNSARSPQLTQALNKLDAMTAKYPGLVVSLFGYTEWLMYTGYNLDRFFKYDTYIPSTFYYNSSSAKTIELENAYRSWFHGPMQQALPRFALTGYDHAQYFIQGVYKYGKDFEGKRTQNNYRPVQTQLYFKKSGKGGYRNQNFQLIHYTFNRQIESINY